MKKMSKYFFIFFFFFILLYLKKIIDNITGLNIYFYIIFIIFFWFISFKKISNIIFFLKILFINFLLYIIFANFLYLFNFKLSSVDVAVGSASYNGFSIYKNPIVFYSSFLILIFINLIYFKYYVKK